jgi:hypothetical protein
MAANPIGALVAIVIAAIAAIVALTVGVVKLFQAFKRGKKDSEEPVVNSNQLNEELDVVKDHLQMREQALRDSYRKEREEVQQAFRDRKISEAEFFAQLRKINQDELNELYGLHKDNFERQIALTEKKIKVGRATTEDLKKIVAEYYDWVKAIYGEDSEEYIDALSKKLDGEKEYRDKLKKLQDDLDSFRRSLRTREQILSDSLAEQLKQQREFRNNNLISEAEYRNNLRLLNEQYENEVQNLELQRHRDDVALAERKIKLGLATNEELKTQLMEYESFVLLHYETDSEAYLSMLEKK